MCANHNDILVLADQGPASVYTEMNAVSKGISLGLYDKKKEQGLEASTNGAQPYVELIGRRCDSISCCPLLPMTDINQGVSKVFPSHQNSF